MDYTAIEIAGYYGMADPDTVRTCENCYKDKAKARLAAAETAYILANHALPEWGTVIERFEIIDGNFLFIHADPDAAN